jgi:hypothetical protein
VAAIVPGASPDDPATATLAHPLFWTHAVGAAVVPVALQPPGPVNPLAVAAIRGDACALLTGTAGLASGDVVEISGGSAPEYHHVRLFSTLSGPDGSFALPPLSRVAQARLRIADGVHPAVTLHHMPSYGRAEEHVDVILH